MVAASELKAPFPYPGGKSRVADTVWSRFGNVDNYIEPFAGSLAVLLRRPADHFEGRYRVETVNDANHYLVNFWRAVTASPDEVARFADWPVNEADIHARHKWLVRSREAGDWRKKMADDPHHYDAKIAGWWCWGICCWIGSGWCSENWTADGGDSSHKLKMPELLAGRGVTTPGQQSRQIPELASGAGRGYTPAGTAGRQQLCDAFDIGRGVNGGAAACYQVPLISSMGNGVYSVAHWQGTCDSRREWLTAWMRRLADRLRLVRTCYGHWSRVCDSDSTLTRLGRTAVFLDPPYPANRADNGKKSRDPNLYATDRGADLNALRDEVRDWCQRWGADPNILVAVCGYEGDGYEALLESGWTVHAWEANGGYANQRRKGRGKADNAKRERIWFSPHCLSATRQASLFDEID